ncbi:uncharacterized protein LOC142182283 [Nicotiana tabacum]|uniref:Uncharacterized protein LOC142182283 n=1 Tax=Nicotiana tabacum TaxID=4097 RepID=A0AC58USV6_TOBAC
MISNNEDEVNMENISITSDRIEEIAESFCASRKLGKRVSLEINQKVEFTVVRSCSKRYKLKCIVDKCGTYTSIKGDAQNRFAYMFFAPAASVASWSYCRPVIAVDATFLKSKYRGILFVAVSKDANNQIFPLCFGVAESENNEAYIWFFGEMRKAIQVRRELVFLSDRNQSIANGIRKVFPEAHHGICLYHFEKNLKQRHAKATIINLFQSAARSYKREDFNQLMSQLKSIDKKTYNYIMKEPPERGLDHGFHNDVFNLDSMLFRINSEGIKFIVDLKKRTCDCLKFQLDELPYPRAIAAINKRYMQKSDYCSNWYSKEIWLKTYEGYVNTVGDQKSWDIPQNVQSEITKPPDVEILQGRRQKKRHIPMTESVPFKSTKCSRCKQVGHNRTTCLSSPAPHPYSKKHTEKYSNL